MHRLLSDVQKNWKSGLTVALVSIPLSLSLAIASNAEPVTGIITAFWAGLIAAIFGGSKFNIIGPAGALSGILTAFVLTHGIALLPMLAICSGVAIFVCYLLRWDRYLVFVPSSVIHGFTLGVGLIIGLGQINFALGLSGLQAHESFLQNVWESVAHASQAQPATVMLFLAMLGLLFAILTWFPRIPGAIVAAVLGICIGYLGDTGMLPVVIPTLASKYSNLSGTLFQLPLLTFAPLADMAFLKTVATVAVVAILETLLSAKIADGMTKTKFDQRKETFGLALANIGSGLAGGLPATGVLARTALNAKSGATSAVSQGINAAGVAVIALLLFGYFRYLPLAVVAAILVFASIRMVEGEHFVKLFRFDKTAFFLSLLVAALTVIVDPLVAILAGATISLLIFVQHLSKGQSEISLHHQKKLVARIPHHKLHLHTGESDVIVYRLAGELTYFNGKSHEEAVKKLKTKTVILSLRNLFYIDLDGLETLHEMIADQEARKRTVVLTGASEFIEPLLVQTPWFAALQKKKRYFPSTTEALSALGHSLKN